MNVPSQVGNPEAGFRKVLLTMLMVVAVSACSNPQIRTHTLVPPPQLIETEAGSGAITIKHVTVPPQLNRSELVVRKGESQLMVLESDWWGAPLPEEIRSALGARLGPSENADYLTQVWVSVTRFDAIPGQSVWLDADYRLAGNPDLVTSGLTCSIRHRSEAGNTVDSMVRAHQLNVEVLAGVIIAAVRSLNAGSPGCP